MTEGDEGGHVEGVTEGRAAGAGNGGVLVNRGARLMVLRVETSKGDQLTDVGKVGQGTAFSQELASGQVTNAGNTGQQVFVGFEGGMVVQMVADSLFGLGQLLIQQGQVSLQLLLNQWGSRASLQTVSGLLTRLGKVLIMAHQGTQFTPFGRWWRPARGLVLAAKVGQQVGIDLIGLV